MTTDAMSPERTRAFYKFKEAEHQAARHHYDQAISLAREALDIDPEFVDVRHWIAGLYVRLEQPRKASLEYQEILHANRDDTVAWARLREVDAAAADRLERLHDIAPDPFVVQRTADNAVSGDLDDLGGLGDEFLPEEEEVLLPSHGGAEALDSLEDLDGTDAVRGLLQSDVGAVPLGAAGSGGGAAADLDDLDATDLAAPAEPALAAPEPNAVPMIAPPSEWAYEEDTKYRLKLDNHPVYSRLLPRIKEFWNDTDRWDLAISGSVHLDHSRHPEIVAVVREVESRLGAPQWTLYVCPERRMVCCITRGNPPTISLTTGVINALQRREQLFAIGRYTSMLVAGHVAYHQMAMLTLERSPRSITDVEIDMLELLKNHHSGWDTGVHREDRMKLGALCHAWQQRAEITADRGGLLCCGDLDVACNGIAKTVAADSNAAATATWKGLVEKYKGQDAAQLAAIPPKEDPARHEGYAVYRIQMLRWWAHTAEGKALLAP